MALTCSIPTSALPVLEEIRRLVARPTKKARLIKQWSVVLESFYLLIRWPNSLFGGSFSVNKRCYGCCPLGMIPKAHALSPGWVERQDNDLGTPGFTAWKVACQVFYKWFDKQTDIPAVTEAIWPEESND